MMRRLWLWLGLLWCRTGRHRLRVLPSTRRDIALWECQRCKKKWEWGFMYAKSYASIRDGR